MTKLPGDPKIAKLFGFPGFEAMIATTVKHLNALKKEAGQDEVTYNQFVSEVEAERVLIVKDSESKET